MPYYPLICDGCGWKGESFHAMKDENPPCPKCKAQTRVDWRRQTVPGLGGIREWVGRESRSLAYGVMPEEIPMAKKLYPSMEYDPVTGDAIFHNDKHHRKCLKEIEEVNRILDEQDAERQAAETQHDIEEHHE